MYKIFLADDEIWETIGLKKLIEKTGLPVRVVGEAENGTVALEQIERKAPDILITDIRMPGLTGLELARQIRERGLETDVILLSGYAQFEYARTAMQWGVREYLLKPVEESALREALSRILEQKVENENEEDAVLETGEGESVAVIKQILKEIEQSYTEDITLSGLSEKYNISNSRLSTRLKEILGMSFSKYLSSLRIQHAKELLADERLSVEQIAEMVGYRDYFYFIRVFKRVTGVTPSVYRKSL